MKRGGQDIGITAPTHGATTKTSEIPLGKLRVDITARVAAC